MRVLLVYPSYPESFWSFKLALQFIGAKAAHPPLALLTVAALLPNEWEKRLIDLNVTKLSDTDLQWADYVMISAMAIQKPSVMQIIGRCKEHGVKVVAGGPLFTMEPEAFPQVDHLVLNEGEVTIPAFLADLSLGRPEHVYTTDRLPELIGTPLPRWELINMKHYGSMSIQYSRGCPYDCEFCDITTLFGRKPRLKSTDQFIGELDELYHHGWRGTVFIVDDNFIGNKARIKTEVLPAMIEWMHAHKSPFWFTTEASINLADDEELMVMMHQAGFNAVFVGIETPSEESLAECNKYNNMHRDLISSVKRMQNHGLQVSGGFIVGFDSDTPSIFERQINFIQQSGIVTAMVGLLHAPTGTRLFERLKREKRLVGGFSGNNTDLAINFIPKMNLDKLIEGYKMIVATIYDPSQYYQRVLEFFKEFKPTRKKSITMLRFCHIKALFRSMPRLGLLEKGNMAILETVADHPDQIPVLFP